MAAITTTLTKESRKRASRKKDTQVEAQTIIKQDTVTDLTSFEEVTLRKVGTFTPVEKAGEALERLGNDTGKFLKVINDGLRAEAIRALAQDASVAWQEYDVETKELKPFTGKPASKKVVNPLVLTLAKTMAKYNKDMTAEQKAAAKDKARKMIQSSPEMMAGLVESAASIGTEAEEEE